MANDIQSGSIVRKSDKYYVRYRKDDGTKPYIFICPADPKAPDYLDKHEREKRRVQIIDSVGCNSTGVTEETKDSISFAVAAASWLHELETRDYRKKISLATSKNYKSHLARLNSLVGTVPLAKFTAKTLGECVQELKNAGLASKTIRELAAVAKQVVASITDYEGEPLYPRKWPEKVCRIPLQGKQKQPCFQAPEVEKIVEMAEAQAPRYGALCALLAGTGLRFSEALAIELGPEHPDSSTVSKDCRVVHVRRSVFGLVKTDVKTKSAVRDVDLCPELAEYLKKYIGSRTSGYLFQSASGQPLSQRNVLRDCLHPHPARSHSAHEGGHEAERTQRGWHQKIQVGIHRKENLRYRCQRQGQTNRRTWLPTLPVDAAPIFDASRSA